MIWRPIWQFGGGDIMAVALTSDITQGTLTGSPTVDTIATAAAGSKQETWSILFRNYHASSRTLEIWVNGSTDAQKVYSAALATGETVIMTISVGPSDYVNARASAASSIAWICSKGILT